MFLHCVVEAQLCHEQKSDSGEQEDAVRRNRQKTGVNVNISS